MTIGTVVLLPAAELPVGDGAGPEMELADDLRLANLRRELAAELSAYGVSILLVPPAAPIVAELDLKTATAHWIAHNALAITQALPEQPILLVAFGAAGRLMPALGFSQKASRRNVAGYVIVDGNLPKIGAADWPDAPVTVVTTPVAAAETVDECAAARLRGWTVESDSDPGVVLRGLVTGD